MPIAQPPASAVVTHVRASAPPPLGDGQAFARLALRLTAAGERVLRGEADRVELLGLDRWLGGTHVTAGHAWRWDPTARRLVSPRPGTLA